MLSITSIDRSAVKVKHIDYRIFSQPMVARLPLKNCEVCVIVPVRNEAKSLKNTLLALTNQIDLIGRLLNKSRYEIIVLANNCTDNSAEIARRFARSQPDLMLHIVEMEIKGDRAHIGWVRKLLMDEACRRFKLIGRNGVIISTDGDTRVSNTWIAATLSEIERGADAVGGRIITKSEETTSSQGGVSLTDSRERSKLNKATRLYYLRHLRYGYLSAQLESYIDPYFESLPRHHHHYGASLAVTAQMYAKVGGLPPLRSSEDVALYEALKRVDARFRHSPQVRVITSARSIGRAEAGLSARLSQLSLMAQNNESVLVEPAELIQTRYYLRRWLRYLWQRSYNNFRDEFATMAQKLDLNRDLLEETVLRSPTYGLLLERIKQYQRGNQRLDRGYKLVTIQKANADLEMAIDNIRERRSNMTLDALEQIEPISLFPQPL